MTNLNHEFLDRQYEYRKNLSFVYVKRSLYFLNNFYKLIVKLDFLNIFICT
jgi:hypothetical protein